MIQGGRYFRFTSNAAQRLPVPCRLIKQEFECDKAIKASVLGLVDHTHASNPQLSIIR
jgi:hypothetical protein